MFIDNLAQYQTEPVGENAEPARPEEVAALHPQVPSWNIEQYEDGRALSCGFWFAGSQRRQAFLKQVRDLAREAGREPEIEERDDGSLRIVWQTPQIGDLHVNDFILAAKTDGASRRGAGAGPAEMPTGEDQYVKPAGEVPSLREALRKQRGV